MKFSIAWGSGKMRGVVGGHGGLGVRIGVTTILLGLHAAVGWALQMDINSAASVKGVAQVLTNNLMEIYPGNKTGGTPGIFGGQYYWWEAGAVMGALVDYWAYTGDEGHLPTVKQAMMWQVGENKDYEPSNVTRELGNDDQSFWCLAALRAAELKFPDPPSDQPQWLALAQAVFNRQASRWDLQNCGGGLRWQVVQLNKGYDYKNTVSNGLFFQIGARLARYTGNATYAEWAEKAYDWLQEVGFMNANDPKKYKLFDGANIANSCQAVVFDQWTYNQGIILAGAAYMYNYTNGTVPKWKNAIDGLLGGSEVFFSQDKPNVMYEVICESQFCNRDQRSFKAYLSRFFAYTVQMAPYTADFILPKLRASAVAAARQCNGGSDQKTCGVKWTVDSCDGDFAPGILGQTLSALEVVQSTLILSLRAPVTANTGGTSKGDPNAGVGGNEYKDIRNTDTNPIRTGEKVGAVLVTMLVMGMFAALAWFMITDQGTL